MTEAEWAASRTSRKLLAFLRGRLSERKLRLIGCACVELVWSRVKLSECQGAFEVAVRIAEGTASEEQCAHGFRLANFARDMVTGTAPGIPRRYKTREAWCASWAVYELVVELDRAHPEHSDILHDCVEKACGYLADMPPHPAGHLWRQARVFRDVVGNPFRSVAFHREWRTSDVALLAQRAYDTRDFAALPILADALQDAGCDSVELLTHLRDPNVLHVRGCWALDLVLGKS